VDINKLEVFLRSYIAGLLTEQFIKKESLFGVMVVGDDRQRYISFIIEGAETDRRGMINAIRNEFSREEYEEIKPWLTVFEGDRGILRCKHIGKERAVEVMNEIEVDKGKVKTIITSGTIKKAKKALKDHDR